MKPNITMIGMPSSGKSTVGVLLAKRLGFSFIDVDIVIQEKEGRLLKEIMLMKAWTAFWKWRTALMQAWKLRCPLSPQAAVLFTAKRLWLI